MKYLKFNSVLIWIIGMSLLGIFGVTIISIFGKLSLWEMSAWALMWFTIEVVVALFVEYLNESGVFKTRIQTAKTLDDLEKILKKMEKKKGKKRKTKELRKFIAEVTATDQPSNPNNPTETN